MKKLKQLLPALFIAAVISGCSNSTSDLTEFSFNDISPAAIAEITGSAIAVTVPYATDLSSLVASFTTTGISVSVNGIEQVSGETANDFTSPVTYRVTAEDGSTSDYAVTVTAALNPAREITSFSFLSEKNPKLSEDLIGVIDGNAITLRIPYSADISTIVSSLIPTYTTTGVSVIADGVEQETDSSADDFSYTVVFKITAEDGSTREYDVNLLITVDRSELDTMILNNLNVSMADTSGITDMNNLFLNFTSFNQDISGWDVSNVKDMNHMFSNAKSFNQDISDWDVSSVEDMSWMFYAAESFNQDISGWEVGNVEDMSWMFANTITFNQEISGWSVDKVKNMYCMFVRAYVFNGDISQWNVGNVTDMESMFDTAYKFNADLSKWNVSSVTNMSWMFFDAKLFNQNLSGWNVGTSTLHTEFENGSALINDHLPLAWQQP